MNNGSVRKRVDLDGFHSLDISVCEEKQTVVTELIIPEEEPVFIYAEKFNEPCNYFKEGIRKGIEYLNSNTRNKRKGG